MYTPVKRLKVNKSKAVGNSVAQKRSMGRRRLIFADNRRRSVGGMAVNDHAGWEPETTEAGPQALQMTVKQGRQQVLKMKSKVAQDTIVQRAVDPMAEDLWDNLNAYGKAVFNRISKSPGFTEKRQNIGEHKLLSECANLGFALEQAESVVKQLMNYATMVNQSSAKKQIVAKELTGALVGTGASLGSLALTPVAAGVGKQAGSLAGHAVESSFSAAGAGIKKAGGFVAEKTTGKIAGSEDINIAKDLRKATGKTKKDRSSATEWMAEKWQDTKEDKYWIAGSFVPAILTAVLSASTVLTGGLALIPGLMVAGLYAAVKAAHGIDAINQMETRLLDQGENELRDVLKKLNLSCVIFKNSEFCTMEGLKEIQDAVFKSYKIIQDGANYVAANR